MRKILLVVIVLMITTAEKSMLYGQSGIAYRCATFQIDTSSYYLLEGNHHCWRNEYLVACNRESFNQCRFTLMNVRPAPGLAANVYFRLPVDIDVRDFQIVGDMVFFCGTYNNQGSGIGWFDINELYTTTSAQVTVHGQSIPLGSDMKQLNKMIAYQDNNVVHLVVAGSNENYRNVDYNLRIVDCEFANNQIVNPKQWICPSAIGLQEYYNELNVVGDYLVLTGIYLDLSMPLANGYCFRRYKLGGIANGQIDTCFHLNIQENVTFAPRTEAVTTQMLALISYSELGDFRPLRLLGITVPSMCVAFSQVTTPPEKVRPTDLVYCPQADSLVVSIVHPYALSSGYYGELFLMSPYPVPLPYYSCAIESQHTEYVSFMLMLQGRYLTTLQQTTLFVRDLTVPLMAYSTCYIPRTRLIKPDNICNPIWKYSPQDLKTPDIGATISRGYVTNIGSSNVVCFDGNSY